MPLCENWPPAPRGLLSISGFLSLSGTSGAGCGVLLSLGTASNTLLHLSFLPFTSGTSCLSSWEVECHRWEMRCFLYQLELVLELQPAHHLQTEHSLSLSRWYQDKEQIGQWLFSGSIRPMQRTLQIPAVYQQCPPGHAGLVGVPGQHPTLIYNHRGPFLSCEGKFEEISKVPAFCNLASGCGHGSQEAARSGIIAPTNEQLQRLLAFGFCIRINPYLSPNTHSSSHIAAQTSGSPAHTSTCSRSPPWVIDSGPISTISQTLDSHWRCCDTQYFVHWKGYCPEEQSVHLGSITHCGLPPSNLLSPRSICEQNQEQKMVILRVFRAWLHRWIEDTDCPKIYIHPKRLPFPDYTE